LCIIMFSWLVSCSNHRTIEWLKLEMKKTHWISLSFFLSMQERTLKCCVCVLEFFLSYINAQFALLICKEIIECWRSGESNNNSNNSGSSNNSNFKESQLYARYYIYIISNINIVTQYYYPHFYIQGNGVK
jgi:hypothetical protein